MFEALTVIRHIRNQEAGMLSDSHHLRVITLPKASMPYPRKNCEEPQQSRSVSAVPNLLMRKQNRSALPGGALFTCEPWFTGPAILRHGIWQRWGPHVPHSASREI